MSAFLARAPRRLRSSQRWRCFSRSRAGAAAQTETGRITGVVTDATGGILPGVTVTAKAVGTGATRELVTDSAGQYVFANLPPAHTSCPRRFRLQYREHEGDRLRRQRRRRRLQTRLAGTQGEPQRRCRSSARSTSSTPRSPTTITQTQIRELPTLTRDVYDLVGVAGNVADDESTAITSGATPRGAGYAINGMRASSTNVLLDGSANNDEFNGRSGQDVPLDSVQEFSVVTSNFSAQYGRASGGVVNVADEVGDEQLPGTAYEFYRSDKLATNTYDNKANEH